MIANSNRVLDTSIVIARAHRVDLFQYHSQDATLPNLWNLTQEQCGDIEDDDEKSKTRERKKKSLLKEKVKSRLMVLLYHFNL